MPKTITPKYPITTHAGALREIVLRDTIAKHLVLIGRLPYSVEQKEAIATPARAKIGVAQ